jgi:glutamyl-tRNA(Gln) amidotransferase subunit E
VKMISHKYNLSRRLSEQIFDSNYFELFEKVMGTLKKTPPKFVVSKLTEDMVSFERQGLNTSLLTDEIISNTFKKVEDGIVGKESVVLIFERIMKGEAETVQQAIDTLGIAMLNTDQLDEIISKIVEDNLSVITEKQMGSLGMLMGRSMAILRGKVDGQKVNALLKTKLEEMLKVNQMSPADSDSKT